MTASLGQNERVVTLEGDRELPTSAEVVERLQLYVDERIVDISNPMLASLSADATSRSKANEIENDELLGRFRRVSPAYEQLNRASDYARLYDSRLLSSEGLIIGLRRLLKSSEQTIYIRNSRGVEIFRGIVEMINNLRKYVLEISEGRYIELRVNENPGSPTVHQVQALTIADFLQNYLGWLNSLMYSTRSMGSKESLKARYAEYDSLDAIYAPVSDQLEGAPFTSARKYPGHIEYRAIANRIDDESSGRLSNDAFLQVISGKIISIMAFTDVLYSYRSPDFSETSEHHSTVIENNLECIKSAIIELGDLELAKHLAKELAKYLREFSKSDLYDRDTFEEISYLIMIIISEIEDSVELSDDVYICFNIINGSLRGTEEYDQRQQRIRDKKEREKEDRIFQHVERAIGGREVNIQILSKIFANLGKDSRRVGDSVLSAEAIPILSGAADVGLNYYLTELAQSLNSVVSLLRSETGILLTIDVDALNSIGQFPLDSDYEAIASFQNRLLKIFYNLYELASATEEDSVREILKYIYQVTDRIFSYLSTIDYTNESRSVHVRKVDPARMREYFEGRRRGLMAEFVGASLYKSWGYKVDLADAEQDMQKIDLIVTDNSNIRYLTQVKAAKQNEFEEYTWNPANPEIITFTFLYGGQLWTIDITLDDFSDGTITGLPEGYELNKLTESQIRDFGKLQGMRTGVKWVFADPDLYR